MKRWVALVVLLVVSTLGLAIAPAQAAPGDCDDTYFSTSGRELFTPDPAYVPPPLRGTGWDCASRIAGDSGDTIVSAYDLVWVGISWDRFVSIVRAFEDAGWSTGPLIDSYDYAGGGAQPIDTDTDPALSADDLAGLEPMDYAHARFSNAATGRDIITIDYYDGQTYDGFVEADEPHLVIDVIVNQAYVPSTGLADPSTLSTLKTIFAAAPTPAQWAVIGSGSFVLMLLVGWPSTLLNSVVGTRYQSLVHRITTRRRAKKGEDAAGAATTSAAEAPPARPRTSRLPGWLMWPGFALAAILGAFVDPSFGWNPMSLRVVVTLFLSFLLFNLATWFLVRAVARRLQPDSDPYLRFRWGSLVIVIIAVLVARLLGLQPGVIFGLVAGIAYATTLQAAKSAVVTIVGSAFGLALAIVAWIAYSFLAPLETTNVVIVFLVEFLAGVVTKGVSTLPLSLLPLGNLDGTKLFSWRKLVWGVSYVVGLAAFMIVIATIPKSWGEVPDLLRWSWIFGAYALLAVIVWFVNAQLLKRRPLPPERAQGDQPDAITID